MPFSQCESLQADSSYPRAGCLLARAARLSGRMRTPLVWLVGGCAVLLMACSGGGGGGGGGGTTTTTPPPPGPNQTVLIGTNANDSYAPVYAVSDTDGTLIPLVHAVWGTHITELSALAYDGNTGTLLAGGGSNTSTDCSGGNNYCVYSVQLSTGVASDVLGGSWLSGAWAMAIDPTNGTLYFVNDPCDCSAALLAGNPSTGAYDGVPAGCLTTLTHCAFNGSTNTNALYFDATGNLYSTAYSGSSAQLYSVDKTTAVATSAGTFSLSGGHFPGAPTLTEVLSITRRPSDGTIFAIVYTDAAVPSTFVYYLVTLDLSTPGSPVANYVATLPGEVDSIAYVTGPANSVTIPSQPAISGFTFVDGGGTSGIEFTSGAVNPSLGALSGKLYATWNEPYSTQQIRLATFDGIADSLSDWTFVDGNDPPFFNKDATKNAIYPDLATLNGKLYAMWLEDPVLAPNEVTAAVYNGNDIAPARTIVDGTGSVGINKDTTKSANPSPVLQPCNGKLYATWIEPDATPVAQVRVAVYNGNDSAPSWSFVDVNGAEGLNHVSTNNASAPVLACRGTTLYAAWSEQAGTSPPAQIRLAAYNGNDSAPAWAFMDGGGTTGLNYAITLDAQTPSLAVFGYALYVAWSEADAASGVYQIRVALHDPLDGNSDWDRVDGNGAEGLNAFTAYQATTPFLGVADGRLYLTWAEVSSTPNPTQIRAKLYNGVDSSPAWTSVDGNGANGLNYAAANAALNPRFGTVGTRLYVTWSEGSPAAVRVMAGLAAPTITSAVAGAGTSCNVDTTVIVTWNPVPGATSYNLYWAQTSGSEYPGGTKTTGVTSPYTLSTGVYSNYLELTAVYGSLESIPSPEVLALVGSCG